MTVTDFVAEDEDGAAVNADAHGNNVAFACLDCGAPVLAIARQYQRGSASDRPATCRPCKSGFWIEPIEAERRIVVHRR